MLQEGQHKGICVIQGECERLPFDAETFDRIVLVDAFHHLIDQSAAVSELTRVLATYGRLVIEEPDITHWGVKLAALGEKLLLMRSHFYTPLAIQRLFERIGNRVCIERQAYTVWIIVDKGL
jgi:demethylmenaquinone methyltransferase/2-methoxy-6-polyprenyl-1,4-benzoquinol methylase